MGKDVFSDIPQRYYENFSVWRTDIGKSRPTGGESVAELRDRVVKCFTRLAKENQGKIAYVVSHGTPIRALINYIESQPKKRKNIIKIKDLKKSEVEIEPNLSKKAI